jgi:hypothetical protein
MNTNYVDWINANRVAISFFVAGAAGVGSAVYLIIYLTRRSRQAEAAAQITPVEVSSLLSYLVSLGLIL